MKNCFFFMNNPKVIFKCIIAIFVIQSYRSCQRNIDIRLQCISKQWKITSWAENIIHIGFFLLMTTKHTFQQERQLAYEKKIEYQQGTMQDSFLNFDSFPNFNQVMKMLKLINQQCSVWL